MPVVFTPQDFTVLSEQELPKRITAARLQAISDALAALSDTYTREDWSVTETVQATPRINGQTFNRYETVITSIIAEQDRKADRVDLNAYAETQWVHNQNFADETWVNEQIASAITSGTIDLSDYARQDWVTAQGYITSIPTNYATTEWVTTQNYATQNWVTSRNYLTAVPNTYATAADTQAWVNSQGFATQTWVGEQGYLTVIPDTITRDTELTAAIQAHLTSAPHSSGGGGVTLSQTAVDPYVAGFRGTIALADSPATGAYFTATHTNQLSPIGTNTLLVGPVSTNEVRFGTTNLRFFNGTTYDTAEQFVRRHESTAYTPVAADINPIITAYRGVLGGTDSRHNVFGALGDFNDIAVAQVLGRTNSDSSADNLVIGGTSLPTNIYNLTTAANTSRKARWHWRHAEWNMEGLTFINDAGETVDAPWTGDGTDFNPEQAGHIYPATDDTSDLGLGGTTPRRFRTVRARTLELVGNILPTSGGNSTLGSSLLNYFESGHIKHIHLPTGGSINFQTASDAPWATQSYVDTQISGVEGGTFTGGEITDDITFDDNSVRIGQQDGVGNRAMDVVSTNLSIRNLRPYETSDGNAGLQFRWSYGGFTDKVYIKARNQTDEDHEVIFDVRNFRFLNSEVGADLPWLPSTTVVPAAYGDTDVADYLSENNYQPGAGTDITTGDHSVAGTITFASGSELHLDGTVDVTSASVTGLGTKISGYLAGSDVDIHVGSRILGSFISDARRWFLYSDGIHHRGLISFAESGNIAGLADIGNHHQNRAGRIWTLQGYIEQLYSSSGTDGDPIEVHDDLELQDGVNVTRPSDAAARPLFFTHSNPGGIAHFEAMTLHGPTDAQNGVLDVDEVRTNGNSTTSKLGGTSSYFNEGYITNLYSSIIRTAALTGTGTGTLPAISWGTNNNIGSSATGGSFDAAYIDEIHAFGRSRFATIAPPTTGTRLLTLAPQAANENLTLGGSLGTQTISGEWSRASNGQLSGFKQMVWTHTVTAESAADIDVDTAGTWSSGWTRTTMLADTKIKSVVWRIDMMTTDSDYIMGTPVVQHFQGLTNGIGDWAGTTTRVFSPINNTPGNTGTDFLHFAFVASTGVISIADSTPIPAGSVIRLFVEYI